ncbi:MAG: hypothetical protein ACM3OH_09500 [Bacillota bacterium]
MNRARLGALGAVAATVAFSAPAGAQTPDTQRCRVQIVSVGDTGRSVQAGGQTSYYAGGGVRLKCLGQNITMASDSVVAYPGGDVEFIGRMRYRDSTVAVDADRVTYRKGEERWEARGAVVSRSLTSGSTIRGPAVDYLRRVVGVRDTFEVLATGRPHVDYFARDSAGERREPYVIVADRLHAVGEDRMWGGGRVTIDRSDIAARSDSLRLDTGAGNDGTLIGKPVFSGLGTDSFTVSGTRIDFALSGRQVRSVRAGDHAHAIKGEWDLVADTILIGVAEHKVERMFAWGRTTRPKAVGKRYEVRGDSLAFDLPRQVLTEARAFGSAWVGGAVDSATGNRDWMQADTIVAAFAKRDSAGASRTALDVVRAHHDARSFHSAKSDRPGRPPSLSYVRGDTITLTMKKSGEEGVERVDVHGHADGVQLEPQSASAAQRPPAALPARR